MNGEIIPEKQSSTWEELEALESKSEQEAIELELKQGLTPDRRLCRKCRCHRLIENGALNNAGTTGEGLWGSASEIICRQRCAIHTLILWIICCGTGELHPLLAVFDHELQFAQLVPEKLPSGEIILAVGFGLRKVGCIRAIILDNVQETQRQAYQIGTAPTAENPDKNVEKVSVSLMRKWLSDCEHIHGQDFENVSHHMLNQPHFDLLLIDVVGECLTKGTSRFRYIALSYV